MNKIVALLCTFLLTGCATVFSGTSQDIHIKVVETQTGSLLSDCQCTVSEGNGAVYPFNANPGVIKVSKNNSGVVINCQKNGYRQLNMAVGNSFNAVTVINVLFWPGFIIDAVSGAYKNFPSHYVVSMEKLDTRAQ